ncbi:MAG: PAS domain S-box protein, partial [Steroidobacteraceae bacterium]
MATSVSTRLWWRALGVGIGYAAIASASLSLVQSLGSNAYPWPANAIFLALLCRMPREDWPGSLVAIALATALVDLVQGNQPLTVDLGLGFVNALEIGVGVWLVRDVLKLEPPHFRMIDAVKVFIAAGIVAPLVPSLLVGLIVDERFSLRMAGFVGLHELDAILMFAIFAPPILFYSKDAVRKLWAPRHRLENLAFPVGLAIFVYLDFRYVPFPFVTLVMPLLVAAYRQGPFGVSVGALLAACEVIALWVSGVAPPHVDSTGADPLASLPLIAIASTVCSPIALALTVAETRRIRRRLVDSERETQEIIDRSPTGIGVFAYGSEEGVLNRAFLKMLKREELAGQPVPLSCFTDPEAVKADHAAALDVVAGSNEFIRGPRTYTDSAGRRFSVNVIAALIRDGDGNPHRWVLQAEDVDERLRHEAQLLTERRRLRVALESVGDGVLITDSAGAVRFANDAACTTLQATADQLVGRSLDAILILSDPVSGHSVKSLMPLAVVRGDKVTRPSAAVLHAPDGSVRYIR